MFENFKDHITNNLPFLKRGRLLIAISGGLDSVVLTHLCNQLKLDIALAHCNFNLRSEESDADEVFVLQLAEQLNLEIFTQRFDTTKYATTHKYSIQMAARELRYNWFDEISTQLDFDFILTAHHADDNLETFLINFTRGTGLEGLTGIPEINGKFVRPLLTFSREAIEAYAKKNNMKWREDSSNKSVKYLRNKLRQEVIPILKEINPSLLQRFHATLEYLNGTSDIVEESTNAVLKRAITTIDEAHIAFKISEFKKVNNSKAYLFEVFKDFGFTEWDDMVDLLDAETGKQLLSSTHRLIKNREHLLLTHLTTKKEEQVVISKDIVTLETAAGILCFDKVNTISESKQNTIYVDKDVLNYPLVLRKKEKGDIFYPLGMTGKKKLSKYFKDEKLSLLDKENTWLLCSGNDIVWVVGRRADNRYKVTPKTKNIIAISVN